VKVPALGGHVLASVDRHADAAAQAGFANAGQFSPGRDFDPAGPTLR
jgi:hypothetical protein